MKRLLLVRHGESEWNSARRLQGQADIGLSERGRDQVRQLRGTIAALEPDMVLTSDLKRAAETAMLLGYGDAVRSAALREIDVGDWTGVQIGELVARDGTSYRGWRAGTYAPPGGESWSDFAERTSRTVAEALCGDATRLLVVCHGGVIRSLLQSLVGLPSHRMVPVGPASLSIVAVRNREEDDVRLELLNFSPAGPILDAPD